MIKLNTPLVISFMGVDGVGKSTLITSLNKRLKKNSFKIKNLHLRPYFFLTDTRTVIKNPHEEKSLNSKFISLIRILIWLFMYRIFFLENFNSQKKIPQLETIISYYKTIPVLHRSLILIGWLSFFNF